MLNYSDISVSPTRPVPEGDSIEERACQVFDRAFSEAGTTPASVVVAFQGILHELPQTIDREESLRDVAKAAALSTARSHGNIIDAGRTLLANIDELGHALSLDVRRCKDQVLLGLAEGACQVGPIVYGRFLDIACEYRDNADIWIAKNKRRPVTFEPSQLPVIVPFEAELTLNTQPFREAPTAEASLPESEPLPPTSSAPPETESTVTWSRPKERGFFGRLSDVMGSFFGRK